MPSTESPAPKVQTLMTGLLRDIGVTHVIFGSDVPPPLDVQLRVLAELRQHLR